MNGPLERFFLKRLTSPARTFVVMMAAALLSISVFFVEPRRLWRVTSEVNLAQNEELQSTA